MNLGGGPRRNHADMIKDFAENAAGQHSDLGNFEEDDIRAGFVRKVFGILAAQLTVTASFVVVTMNNRKNPWFYGLIKSPTIALLMAILYISCTCALICCNMHREVPANYLLLGGITLAMSWDVAFASVEFEPIIVTEAAVLTGAVVLGIYLYSLCTKYDFTYLAIGYAMVFASSLVLLTTIILGFIFSFQVPLFISALGVIIFGFYLLIDLQQVMGGSHNYFTFSPDDYILAALVLYLDIINLFLYILEILAKSQRR